jgi:uncharacterized protein HemX
MKTAEAKTTNANKKRKAKPKKANEKDTNQPAETVLQDTSNTPQVAVCVVAGMGISVRSNVLQRQWERITAVQTSSWRAGAA